MRLGCGVRTEVGRIAGMRSSIEWRGFDVAF